MTVRSLLIEMGPLELFSKTTLREAQVLIVETGGVSEVVTVGRSTVELFLTIF